MQAPGFRSLFFLSNVHHMVNMDIFPEEKAL